MNEPGDYGLGSMSGGFVRGWGQTLFIFKPISERQCEFTLIQRADAGGNIPGEYM